MHWWCFWKKHFPIPCVKIIKLRKNSLDNHLIRLGKIYPQPLLTFGKRISQTPKPFDQLIYPQRWPDGGVDKGKPPDNGTASRKSLLQTHTLGSRVANNGTGTVWVRKASGWLVCSLSQDLVEVFPDAISPATAAGSNKNENIHSLTRLKIYLGEERTMTHGDDADDDDGAVSFSVHPLRDAPVKCITRK